MKSRAVKLDAAPDDDTHSASSVADEEEDGENNEYLEYLASRFSGVASSSTITPFIAFADNSEEPQHEQARNNGLHFDPFVGGGGEEDVAKAPRALAAHEWIQHTTVCRHAC